MADEKSNLDELKFELEKQRLDFDRLKYERENTFFNKNFGVVITAIISVATVFVSVSQIIISYNYNSAQLSNEQRKSDRAFAFDLAKFMLEQREGINTDDVATARYIRNTVIAFFPNEYGARIARSMRDLSGDPDIKLAWADALEYAESLSAPPLIATSVESTLKPEQLVAEFSELSGRDKNDKLKIILEQARKYGIVGKNELSIFLAQIFFNTNFLLIETESLKLSAQRLRDLWPARFKTLEDAKKVENDPEKIANLIYGGRMGNTDTGDGYKYRGRGYLMIAGRANYREIGTKLNVNLEANPDKLLESPTNAQAAAYLFARATERQRKAGGLDLIAASRALNGGLVGLSQMRPIYERIQKI